MLAMNDDTTKYDPDMRYFDDGDMESDIEEPEKGATTKGDDGTLKGKKGGQTPGVRDRMIIDRDMDDNAEEVL